LENYEFRKRKGTEMISYKEFMERVRERLEDLSTEDLRNMILNWASEEQPSNRQVFLYKLIPQKQKEEVIPDVDWLMGAIEDFEERVSNGEYCDGWGWDDTIHEERDFGDESWAEEMDEFFMQARSLLLQGEYKIAEEAYRKLFDILQMGEDPGHLPGDPDHISMLKVEIDEQVALFFRSVYMNSTLQERPDLLYEAMNEYAYLGRSVRLKDIINVYDDTLPDFDIFLTEWIKLLKDEDTSHVSELLREAVFLKGGIPAISEFARQYTDKYPNAYLDWIGALEREGDLDSVILVAREGLWEIPRDYTVRAEVAKAISKAGEILDDNKLRLEGYRECFYSDPTIEHLLDLYITAIECSCFEEIRDESEGRIMELLDKKDELRTSYNYFGEQHRASVSEGILANAMLLGGRYEKVFRMCEGRGSLGWSFRANPKFIFVTFMLVFLSKEGVHSKVLAREWVEAIRYSVRENYIEKYQRVAHDTKKYLKLTEEEENFYLKWCKDEVERRVDEIVSSKFWSYPSQKTVPLGLPFFVKPSCK
jgi:tetratricopeptide (TPR) repeat protein